MKRLQRFLDWFDESASGVIRLSYLFAGITAVAAYFGASDFGSVFAALAHGDLRPLLPWPLAFAVEVNLYLIARRVLASWVALQESARGSKDVTPPCVASRSIAPSCSSCWRSHATTSSNTSVRPGRRPTRRRQRQRRGRSCCAPW
jgi:hypothetical protein